MTKKQRAHKRPDWKVPRKGDERDTKEGHEDREVFTCMFEAPKDECGVQHETNGPDLEEDFEELIMSVVRAGCGEVEVG